MLPKSFADNSPRHKVHYSANKKEKMNMILWLAPLILVGLVEGLKDPICGQEPGVVEICRGAIPSYTYYVKSNTCEYFEYGGCHGNENRFRDKGLCESKCVE